MTRPFFVYQSSFWNSGGWGGTRFSSGMCTQVMGAGPASPRLVKLCTPRGSQAGSHSVTISSSSVPSVEYQVWTSAWPFWLMS